MMREQPGARNNFNILESISVVIKKLAEKPVQKIYKPLTQALETLTELIQGPCKEN